jgi:hypothetical protein
MRWWKGEGLAWKGRTYVVRMMNGGQGVQSLLDAVISMGCDWSSALNRNGGPAGYARVVVSHAPVQVDNAGGMMMLMTMVRMTTAVEQPECC